MPKDYLIGEKSKVLVSWSIRPQHHRAQVVSNSKRCRKTFIKSVLISLFLMCFLAVGWHVLLEVAPHGWNQLDLNLRTSANWARTETCQEIVLLTFLSLQGRIQGILFVKMFLAESGMSYGPESNVSELHFYALFRDTPLGHGYCMLLRSWLRRAECVSQDAIHAKNKWCGENGFFGRKKNWRKIWPKNGLKWP